MTEPDGDDGHAGRSLVEATAANLRRRIIDVPLEAGDSLPSERVLVQELGVSRTVLREALSNLEALGIIEARGRRGRIVAAGGSDRSRTIVSAWLHQHAQQILEVDEIRSVLEAHVFETLSDWDGLHAARRAKEIIDTQIEALDRGDAVAAAAGDAAFHLAFCDYVQNATLRILIEGLIDSSRKGALAVYSLPHQARRSLSEHATIAEALAAGDRGRAAQLVYEHHLQTARRYAVGDADRKRASTCS